jgi:dTMP kinase
VDEVIRPALAAGQIVLCDRYADSTLAYQGYGHGQMLAPLQQLGAYATGGADAGADDLPRHRRARRGWRASAPAPSEEWNRMEEIRRWLFHERVRARLPDAGGRRTVALAGDRRRTAGARDSRYKFWRA